MNYILKPSLEHIVLVKIAVTLWKQDDIRSLIKNFNFRLNLSQKREEWQKIENRVIEKVLKLPQTGILKEKIAGCIKPIGLQILKWIEYHCTGMYIRVNVNLSAELCWSPQGTIDRKKTAEMLVKDESLDVTCRYKLACIYCLEDYIYNLWNKIPKNKRILFHSESRLGVASPQDLVFLWTCDIKQELDEFEYMIQGKFSLTFSPYRRYSPYQYALEYVLDRNKAAVEYFLKKLTPIEREKSLVETARSVATRHGISHYNIADIPDIFCFMLSQMNKQEQMQVFKSCPCASLGCFLDWPWQSFFMDTANCMWVFLDEMNYGYLLEMIVNKVIHGYKDFNYKKLFGEFWQQSPLSHKKYVIDDCTSSPLLPKLFKIKDERNIHLILQAASLTEKKNLILCDTGLDICRDLIFSDEWDLLKFFIQESMLSKEDIMHLIDKYEKTILVYFSKDSDLRIESKVDNLYCLVEDLVCGYDERKNV